ncbi:hypothetical protein EUS_13810 [[Eubacterium] siraeum 70/3]|uniref:Uncharacterized protein n=1 Tax=[Eubacterium] siraeum 70/3 TaxID=657319 RepID=D4JTV4_9FIRM|nr:hypothetical protein EUS_13810 [[Eubacterium] siraeum 70/3]
MVIYADCIIKRLRKVLNEERQ